VKSDGRPGSYRAKEKLRLCGWKLHAQNMTLLRAVARAAIETTASTNSADSNNDQICPTFSPVFINESYNNVSYLRARKDAAYRDTKSITCKCPKF
jgi:hypothetical protein